MQRHTCKLFEYLGLFSTANVLGFLTYQLPDWRSSDVNDHCSHMLTFILYLLKGFTKSTVLSTDTNNNMVVNVLLLRQISMYQSFHLLNIFTADNMTDYALTIKSWNPSNCHWVMGDIEDPQRHRGIWCRSYIQSDGSGGEPHLIPHHTLITPIVWRPHVFNQENWLVFHNIQLKDYFKFFTIWHGLITVSLHYTYLFVS